MGEPKVQRALSVNDVLSYRPNYIEFEGEWLEAIGKPELKGSWIISGNSGMGKTSFAMMLGKYLSTLVKRELKNTIYYRTAYNSIEEGLSASVQDAYVRLGMSDVAGWFDFLDKAPMEELRRRLESRRSPDVVIIDSVQYTGLRQQEYKSLVDEFDDKLFIWISHADGNKPKGALAQSIYYDANVCIRVDGFVAFVTKSRYGGNGKIVISERLAQEYHNF